MSVLGPAIGYVLGGQLLSMYIDVNMGQRQGDISFSFICLFYFNNVNIIERFQRISSDSMRDFSGNRTEYTQYLYNTLSALHELIPYHPLV